MCVGVCVGVCVCVCDCDSDSDANTGTDVVSLSAMQRLGKAGGWPATWWVGCYRRSGVDTMESGWGGAWLRHCVADE